MMDARSGWVDATRVESCFGETQFRIHVMKINVFVRPQGSLTYRNMTVAGLG
jgi:hypothetical protein